MVAFERLVVAASVVANSFQVYERLEIQLFSIISALFILCDAAAPEQLFPFQCGAPAVPEAAEPRASMHATTFRLRHCFIPEYCV